MGPPKYIPSSSRRKPTESGPTVTSPPETPSSLTREPPPRGRLCTSGMVKFVRTPAILTNVADCRGNPLGRMAGQMSVVVLSAPCVRWLARFTRSPRGSPVDRNTGVGAFTLRHLPSGLPCSLSPPFASTLGPKRQLPSHYLSDRSRSIEPGIRRPRRPCSRCRH